jgi:dTDP-4-dehydrorhamnose 3,5-epimerase
LFYYKWSESYVAPEKQFSVIWNDDTLNIKWPLLKDEPILSDRDKKSKRIKD